MATSPSSNRRSRALAVRLNNRRRVLRPRWGPRQLSRRGTVRCWPVSFSDCGTAAFRIRSRTLPRRMPRARLPAEAPSQAARPRQLPRTRPCRRRTSRREDKRGDPQAKAIRRRRRRTSWRRSDSLCAWVTRREQRMAFSESARNGPSTNTVGEPAPPPMDACFPTPCSQSFAAMHLAPPRANHSYGGSPLNRLAGMRVRQAGWGRSPAASSACSVMSSTAGSSLAGFVTIAVTTGKHGSSTKDAATSPIADTCSPLNDRCQPSRDQPPLSITWMNDPMTRPATRPVLPSVLPPASRQTNSGWPGPSRSVRA